MAQNSFTQEEKVRIRHHMGYLNVDAVQTFVLGSPAGVETQFIIEGAMNRVLPEALSLVRNMLAKCDSVEAQMLDNQELLAVMAVGEISVRQDEFQALQHRYHYWRNGLANALGCYTNSFDKRFEGTGLNVSVRH
jgi:hypothetical protein